MKKNLSRNEDVILSLIPRGSERKISTTEIQNSTDLSIRDIRKVIRNLVLYGVPIVGNRSGDNKGMYIATTELERSQGLVQFTSQIEDMVRRRNAIKNADLRHWQDGFSNECAYTGESNKNFNIEISLDLMDGIKQ